MTDLPEQFWQALPSFPTDTLDYMPKAVETKYTDMWAFVLDRCAADDAFWAHLADADEHIIPRISPYTIPQ